MNKGGGFVNEMLMPGGIKSSLNIRQILQDT
jgi:hypothetical protein